jgi:1-acyl-sn-glycerol-3-phosphate acyltransferase
MSYVETTYAAVSVAGRLVLRALGLRVHVEGERHVPLSGPVILASNHVSYLDFLLVGMAARGRRVRFLARYDVWAKPLVGPVMERMRHVPVDRAAPAGAYLRARSLLREGEAVGIFPEAGVSTSYTVRDLMPGAMALARDTGALVVPLAVWGPQRVLTAHRPADLTRGRPVSLLLGEPMRVPPGADVRAHTELLGSRLQGLLEGLQGRAEHRPRPGELAPWHPRHLGGHAPTPEVARLTQRVPRSAVPPPWAPALAAAPEGVGEPERVLDAA